jgi:xylulokinase
VGPAHGASVPFFWPSHIKPVMAYYIGIDVSTTASKALLLDDSGNVVHVASNPHQLSTPRALWSEQDPEEWWHATQESLKEVVRVAGTAADQIRAIGLTGQMHGLVMLDADGDVLRPAMLWNDGRSSAQCNWLRETIGHDHLIDMTGNDAFEGFTLPKLLWVKENEPDIFARTRQILLPKDYIRFRLTGEYGTDRAGAGGTLMLDLRTRDWSTEILDACNIPLDWLPKTHEGPEITGSHLETVADALGLTLAPPSWPAAVIRPQVPSAWAPSSPAWYHLPSARQASSSRPQPSL